MQHWWWPAALAVVLYLLLSALALVGVHLLDLEQGTTALPEPAQAMAWPGVWARWDSGYYISIAENGYSVGNLSTAFYPLYPVLMRVAAWLPGLNSVMAGTLLSLLFTALAFVVLYRIVAFDYGADTAWFCVLLIAVFPTAFYFYSIYTEALFLLLSVSAYMLARTKHWGWAVLVCLVAGFGRYNGFLISVIVAVEFLNQHHWGRRCWLPGLLLLAPGLVGFLLYQVYLGFTFGDVLQSFHAQREFGKRYVTWPWISIWDTVKLAATGEGVEGNWFWRLVGWQELFFTGLFVGLCVVSWRLLRPSLGAYLSLSVLMYIASHGPYGMGLLSMPRYLLPLFPAFVVAALLIRRPKWRWFTLGASFTLLVGYTIWFSSGRWVA
jgi:hypothetical protein